MNPLQPDLSLPWCTYRTDHPSHFFYLGKGKTESVLNGSYVGSGTRLHLAFTCPGWGEETWQTFVLDTFLTEAEAYAAEEKLVPITLLSHPHCLNMHAGGLKGKYKTPGALLKQIKAVKRRATAAKKKQRVDEKKALQVAELKSLKLQLKNKGKK